MEFEHVSVLTQELIKYLNPKSQGVYIDCTLGGGGHSLALLELEPNCQIIGIDQDPQALKAAQTRLASFDGQVTYVQDNFRNLGEILTARDIEAVDGIFMDIGVSSPQLDEKDRGFSYQHDAQLDMRMDPLNPISAHNLVNELSATELTKIIRDYGEERWATRIANFIVEARHQAPVNTTGELVDIIKAAIPKKARIDGPHPAKRTFQALRIAVNDELNVLEEALGQAINFLKPRARLAVITFHSLEDRLVKNAFKEFSDPCSCPKNLPVCVCGQKPLVKILTRKPIIAGSAELAENHRARSAKLRACERLPKEEV